VRSFRLQLTKSAAGDPDGIPDDRREKIIKDMEILTSHPQLSQTNVKKLKGFRPLFTVFDPATTGFFAESWTIPSPSCL
jgi:hypothetical protein